MKKLKEWMESVFLPDWLYFSLLGNVMIFLRSFVYDYVKLGFICFLLGNLCILLKFQGMRNCTYCPIEKHKLSLGDIFHLCPDCQHRQCQEF